MPPRGRVRGLPEDSVAFKYLIPFTILLLAACSQDPLALEENIPELADAPIERDVTVYGTMDVAYTTRTNPPQPVCNGEFDILGWVEEDLDSNDTGCTGCSENYTLGPQFVDTNCTSLRARGAPTIALMDFGFYPHDGTDLNVAIYDFLVDDTIVPTGAEGPAERFGVTNWNAVEFFEDDGFDGILGVYPGARASRLPDDVTCVRDAYVRLILGTPINSDTAVRWSMNLCFTE
jgi:hypothetical protein